jgi:hypothetical protein
MRRLLSLLCLPLFLVLAGCSTPAERRLDPPGIQITGLGSTVESATLALRLTNPNTAPLVTSHSTHTLLLGGKRVARIEDAEPIGIPPLGEVTHAVKLPAAAVADMRAWFAKNPGDTRATVESTFVVVVGVDDDTITLKNTGGGTVKAP